MTWHDELTFGPRGKVIVSLVLVVTAGKDLPTEQEVEGKGIFQARSDT